MTPRLQRLSTVSILPKGAVQVKKATLLGALLSKLPSKGMQSHNPPLTPSKMYEPQTCPLCLTTTHPPLLSSPYMRGVENFK